ncbi:MAG TPA: hypothetical protein DDX51_01085 [Clostridiales bacterium]|nr:hypothetical protein [Clostridiales bacterium]
MGILGELNQMAKAGRMEQLHAYLTDEANLSRKECNCIPSDFSLNDPRMAGAHRRLMHHNAEISLASFR